MGNEKQPLDTSLLVATALLVTIGILFVYDASFVRAGQMKFTGRDPEFYLKRQLVWALIGTVGMAAALLVPYWKLGRLAVAGMAITLILLVVVLFFTDPVNGARRWIPLGPIRVQPAELAKLATVLFFAQWLGARKFRVQHLTRGFLPLVVLLCALGSLIVIEPDLGTAIVVVSIGLAMLFLGGARIKHLLTLLPCGLLAVAMMVVVEPYRMERIHNWLNPEREITASSYQVIHSLIALGSGGLIGVGLGQGRQKYFYLPAEHTDYILGTIGEELGFLGTMGLVCLFLYVVVRGFTIAYRTKDPFGSLLAGGLTTMLALQALLNIAVVTKTIPATGLTLPFISYGGSSLVLSMIAMGLLVNISRYPNGNQRASGECKDRYESLVDRRWDGRPRLSSARYR